MGWWSRLFGAPPATVVADVKALPPHAAALERVHGEAVALRLYGDETPPKDTGSIIQPGSQVWRSYPEETITPESLRTLQKQADVGEVSRLMEVYDAMASDAHFGSQLRTRKLAVAGAPKLFDSGDESDQGKVIAEEFAKHWDRIPDPVQMCMDILDDFYRGWSCIRPLYDSVNGKWDVVGHEAIESRYFYFKDGMVPLICPIPGSTLEAQSIPPGYVYSECRDKAGSVVRNNVGRSLAKLYVAKGYVFVDALSFCERYASPHVQVNTMRELKEGDPLLQRIKDAARAFIADQIGIMPAGATLQVIDAVNKGATVRDVFLALIEFCDQLGSKAINGQVLTADAGPGGIGHGGAAKEQGDVRQDIKEFDARRLKHIITCHFAKPWTLWHYGPNAPVPTVKVDVQKPEDKVEKTLAEKQRAETIATLQGAGMRIKAKQQYIDFNLDAPDDLGEDDELEPPAPPPMPTDGAPNTPPGKAAPKVDPKAKKKAA